ncbi:CLUMA_CG013563, isoform A [Clunio marinus]|uniref:CLUMA_CG013563, isoform A n=1 Tax=Clunio marinus TaxID=568069 RepID=A0A1J1IKJ8_9DIPT|nr:CLUMA_CG013563, isoform A [Clunio marinus]
MNVIIRLQNLPWSANATDIRNFFKGLMIPEGGVHIVGGENGDAFIAFSTDEDARCAMQLNGGKIKEVQVTLLLSSRSEMQKVIEKARQASSSSFLNKVAPQQQSTVLPASVIANQFAKKQLESGAAVMTSQQPPVMSLTNLLTHSMQHQQTPQIPSLNQVQQMNVMSAYKNVAPTDVMNSGVPQNAAVAAAAYASYYASLMDPNSANYLNSMTSGLNTKLSDPKSNLPPSLMPASYNKDPRSQRGNSRERNTFRSRHRSRSNERNSSIRSRSSSRERYNDSEKEGRDGFRRRSRFSAVESRQDTSNIAAFPPNINHSLSSANSYAVPPPTATNSIWENPPPQLFTNDRNIQLQQQQQQQQQTIQNSYQMFNNGNSMQLPPTRNYQTENRIDAIPSSSSLGNIGTCVKVANVDNETYYGDLRKFFNGLPIGNNDIKFLTDSGNNRTGVVLIRFLSSDSKKKALTKTMWQLKSTQVIITSISEEDFESGLSNSLNKNRQQNAVHNNFQNDDRSDTRNERYRDRSDSRERDNRGFNHRGNDRYGNNRSYNNNNNNNRDRGNNGGNYRRDQNERSNYRTGNRNDNPIEKEIQYEPDENFTVLIVDDIPRTSSEPDIWEAFPNIVGIVIDRYKAYVKFNSHEAAKVTLENRYIHYIRNKRVFLEAGSEAQYNELVKKFGKYDNNSSEQNEETSDPVNSDQMNDDTNHSSNSNSRDSMRSRDQHKTSNVESRDPRQRNFNNERFGGNNSGPQNMIKTDCIIMKNMETNTTIAEVESFFNDIGIYKMRVHILLDKKGQPCGDCFVEFKYPNDSNRALSKNNQMLKERRVTIMLIPREQVDAVLSSFGGDDSMRQNQQQNRPNRNDWAPPPDFGSPGCVVMLSNLCYKATIEDLLDEFREFDLHQDQIIRRYNDMGQPTGNACINFNSPQDAELACEKHHSVKILNRQMWMKRI